MINRNFVFGFALMGIVLCTSCESPRSLEDGGYYPQEERFTLKERAPSAREIAESRLNFDAVYIPEFPWKSDSGGTFYRFWPTGQVMSQMSSGPITVEKGENFAKAYLGYYAIDGDQITMEFYVPIPGQYTWGYAKNFGKLVPEGILLTGTTNGNIEKFGPITLREHDLGDLEKQPHW